MDPQQSCALRELAARLAESAVKLSMVMYDLGQQLQVDPQELPEKPPEDALVRLNHTLEQLSHDTPEAVALARQIIEAFNQMVLPKE